MPQCTVYCSLLDSRWEDKILDLIGNKYSMNVICSFRVQSVCQTVVWPVTGLMSHCLQYNWHCYHVRVQLRVL
jgi:hypothetical protein